MRRENFIRIVIAFVGALAAAGGAVLAADAARAALVIIGLCAFVVALVPEAIAWRERHRVKSEQRRAILDRFLIRSGDLSARTVTLTELDIPVVVLDEFTGLPDATRT